MDPSASLVTEVAVRVVAGPADNHQDRECGATWKSVFPFHLIDELPHLMTDGRKPLSPLQARVDCANLFQCVLFGLQQLTKSQPGTLGRAIMISHQSKRGVSNNDKIGLTFQRAFHRSEESCRNVLHNLNQFTIGLLSVIGILADKSVYDVANGDLAGPYLVNWPLRSRQGRRKLRTSHESQRDASPTGARARKW